MRLNIRFVLLGFLLLACSVTGRTQSTFGSIVGTIIDSSGNAVQQSAITLVKEEDNSSRTAESSDSGLYEFLNLKPGHYTLLVNKDGYSSLKEAHIELAARQQRRLDLQLSVAAIQTTVEVTSTDVALNLDNATISQTLDQKEIQQLPSNYRGASTSPLGAIVSVPDVQQDSQGNISLAGGSVAMAEFTLDGISTVNVRNNGPNVNMYPSSEMLSEFKVSAVNNNAEYASSGDVTVTSKSGSNRFHGSAFEYLQNRALDATTYGSPSKQGKVWNSFGASFDGPVVLGHFFNGADRTFFFVDYEGNRRRGTTLLTYTVPSDGMRAGNLSAFSDGSSIIDPTTGSTYASEKISTIPVNPVAKIFLQKYYPAPTVTVTSNDLTGDYRNQLPIANTTDGYDVRVDHRINSSQQIAGRWSWKNIPYDQVEQALPSETILQKIAA